MTNINDFDSSLLNVDEVSFESDKFIIYGIKYIKHLNSLNTLYLVFNNLDAYIEKSGEYRFLLQQKKNNNVEKLHRTMA